MKKTGYNATNMKFKTSFSASNTYTE